MPLSPFSVPASGSWPASVGGPHLVVPGPLRHHATHDGYAGVQTKGMPSDGEGSFSIGGGLMVVRPCARYSELCWGASAEAERAAAWRSEALRSEPGKSRLVPWLSSKDTLAGWLRSVSDEYRTVHGAAVADGGGRGFFDVAVTTKDERASGAEWGGLPMVAELGEGGTDSEGRLFALGTGQDRGAARGIVTAGCSMGASKGAALRPASCAQVDRPVVATAQVMCNGPAHFLMECFHRLLIVATAADRAGAVVHVARRSGMVDSFLLAAGVPTDRLVTGCVRSPRLIAPEGTFCGNPSAGSLRLMRRWARGVAGVCSPASDGGGIMAAAGALAEAVTGSGSRPPHSVLPATCPPSMDELGAAVAALGPEEAVRAFAGGTKAVEEAARCLIAHHGAPGVMVPEASARGVRVLFVERKGSREVSNQGDLLQALRRSDGVHAVDVFRPKGPEADAAAFAAADVVVAPHGAGLANTVACPPWAHVIEFLSQPVNIMYGTIATRLGLSWHAFTFPGATHDGAMKVDVPAVVARVEAAASAIAVTALDVAKYATTARPSCPGR